MRTPLALAAALLLTGASAALLAYPVPSPPLCHVTAVSVSRPLLRDRLLSVRLRPDCPPGSVARLRYASRLGGVLPAAPPGYFVLRAGRLSSKPVGTRWWLEWQDRSGRWWHVPEPRGRAT